MAGKQFDVDVATNDEEAKSLLEQGWEFAGPANAAGTSFFKKPSSDSESSEERALRSTWWGSLAGLAGGTLVTLVLMVGLVRIEIDPSAVPGVVNSAIAALLGLVAVAVGNGDKPTPGARLALSVLAGVGVGVALLAAFASAATPS